MWMRERLCSTFIEMILVYKVLQKANTGALTYSTQQNTAVCLVT